MAHHETNENLSPEEIQVNDYIKKGDDFFKIEIFRPALKWYKRALALNPDNPVSKEKVALCESKIVKESRTILYIVAAAVVIIAVVLLVRAL